MNLDPKRFQQVAASHDIAPLINVGCGEDMTVRNLAELIAEVVGISPAFVFDTTKPDGTPRKLLDVRRLNALGWQPRIPLREGLRQTYADFCSRAASLEFEEIHSGKTWALYE
jgi:GDP-L-fucose synthase